MRFSLEDRSPLVEFENLVHLTFEALADVPDFRKARGRQHDLKGVLALIVTGLASGHHSFAAIAAFGKRREVCYLAGLRALRREPDDLGAAKRPGVAALPDEAVDLGLLPFRETTDVLGRIHGLTLHSVLGSAFVSSCPSLQLWETYVGPLSATWTSEGEQ